jgi:hypothetical protein
MSTSDASDMTVGQQYVADRVLTGYLLRADDLHGLVLYDASPRVGWAVDALRSNVVELTAGFYSKNVLKPGRAYYQNAYLLSDGRKVEKPIEYTKWAAGVLSLIRKTLARPGTLPGPHGNFFIGGGTLIDARNGEVVLK